jgi:hypothetical protein
MTYGPGLPALYRRSATYVDKRLKGANPAELPIERPTKVALVTNLKTAKAFVLTISPSLLFQASEVTQCVIPGAWVWLPQALATNDSRVSAASSTNASIADAYKDPRVVVQNPHRWPPGIPRDARGGQALQPPVSFLRIWRSRGIMVETENLLNEMTSPISPALVRAFDHSCVVMAAVLPEQCGPAMPFSMGTFHGLSADMPRTVRQFLRRA